MKGKMPHNYRQSLLSREENGGVLSFSSRSLRPIHSEKAIKFGLALFQNYFKNCHMKVSFSFVYRNFEKKFINKSSCKSVPCQTTTRKTTTGEMSLTGTSLIK